MLEREDYAQITERVLSAFFANPPTDQRDLMLRTTSGTTKGSVVFSLQDQRQSPRILQKWYWGSQRTLVCYGSVAVRFASTIGQFHDTDPHKRILAIDSSDLTSALTPLLADFKPDRVIGFPSFIARAAALFDAETAAGVRTLRSVGEALDSNLHTVLSETFSRATFSTIYHMTEIGAVSFDQCGKAPLSYFHPLPGVTVDINQPDEDGIGDILVSTALFGGIQLERYRCGDIGRMHAIRCPCGATVTFEVLGRRGHDFLKVAGALLVKAEFDRVVNLFPEVSDYRAEASTEGGVTGKLVLRLATVGVLPTLRRRNEIEGAISRELFLTESKTLADLVERRLFAPPLFTWSDLPFDDGVKPVKLKRV